MKNIMTDMKKYWIKNLNKLRQLFTLESLPFFFTRKTMIEFCEWSKQAEWRDGKRKGSFIKNEWKSYIKLFLNDRRANKK